MRNLKSLLAVTIASIFCISTTYACGPNTEFKGSSKVPYEKKGFSSKPAPEFIQKARDAAIQSAWDGYISQCFQAGRMQQYLQLEDQVIANFDRLISVKNERTDVNKDAKEINSRVVITVNRALLDGMFTAGSGAASGGDASVMVWIFAAKQAMRTEGGTQKKFDDRRVKIETSESAATGSQTEVIDGSTAIVAEESESMSRTERGGSTTKRGDIVTATQRDYDLIPTADIDAKISSVLSLNNYEPYEYVDILNECGGAEIEVVQQELAMNGDMSRETRRAVILAMRDCGVDYLAIGTIDVNTPIPDDVQGGYRVNVSVNGQVLDVSKRLPKKVAVIGPVQKRSGGIEDNEATRNALSIAGDTVGNEIVSRLNAKGIQ